jgi:peptide/nickel transport system substrate-binding protein
MSRRTVSALTALTALLALVGALTTASGQGARPTSLTMIIPADIAGRNMDPGASTGGYNLMFLFNVYDGLFKFDRGGVPRPFLVTQHTVSADGLTHTLALRDDVLFHDGTKMTAEDVKFSIDRARGADPSLPNPAGRSYLVAIKSVDVTDPKTVVLRLSQPDPILTNALAYHLGMVVPMAYVKAVGNEGFWKKPIGTGPYQVVDMTPGQAIRLQAVEKYWGPAKPTIKSVTFKIVPDPAARSAQLQAGDVDFVMDMDPSQVDPLRKAGFTVVNVPSGENFIVLWRSDVASLNDPRVGQALNMAVNREAIQKNVYLGYATLSASLDNSPATMDPGLKPYPYDPSRAKQLLTDARFNFNQTLELAVPQGRYLKVEDVAQAMQSDLEKIGVKVKLVSMSYPTWVKDYADKKLGAMTFSSVPNTVYDPVPIMGVVAACGKVFSLWCDQGLEKRFKDLATIGGAARVQAVREMDRYVHENPPAIFLMILHQINGMKPNVAWTGVPGTRVVFLTDITYK